AAGAAALAAIPDHVALGPSRPFGHVKLDGAHVLDWTATPGESWPQVTPASGSLPSGLTISLAGSPPSGQSGTVRSAGVCAAPGPPSPGPCVRRAFLTGAFPDGPGGGHAPDAGRS
ncbi:MAG: hypothetical protein ACOY3Y_15445, partial [Acidobacteriota bacterium]